MEWKIKTFNELSNDELYEIIKLRSEVFVIEQQCIYEECDGKDKKAYHLFGEEDGEILVYLRILDKGVSFNEVSIGRVVANKKYRSKGLAKEMVSRAIEFIEDNLNEKVIRISAQEYLLKFYSSLGFMKVSQVYLEDGIPHMEMVYNNL